MQHLRALLVTADADVTRVFEATFADADDQLFVAGDMSAAVAIAGLEQPALAFVDMTLPGGSGLALVHHVLASHAKTSIVALAPAGALQPAAEALSLGASGLLLLPPDGDAILRAMADVRARRTADETIARISAERGALLDQAEAMTRAVTVARGGDPREIAEALVALFVLASHARGAAFFGPESASGERLRLSAYGSGHELRDRYDDAELAKVAAQRGATLSVFGSASHSQGCVLLERSDPHASARVASAVSFAGALLLISARAATSIPPAPESRVVRGAQFARYVERAMEERSSHAVVLALPPRGGRVDVARLPLHEEGVLCAERDDGGVWILHPTKVASDAYRLLLALGLRGSAFACLPAQGTAAALLSVVEARAAEAMSSPYFDLAVPGPGIGDLATALLRSSALESRISSLFPLELSMPSLESLLGHMLRQASRSPLEVRVAFADPARAVRVVENALSGGSAVLEQLGVRGVPGCEALDAVTVLSPNACWALVGRWEKDRLRAVHTCDPISCAAVSQRIARAKELSQ